MSETGPIVSPSSASSPEVMARFEFEAGKGNEGTKVLMIVWAATAANTSAPNHPAGWDVSWEGKTATFAVTEVGNDGTQRVYFLLPPNATIPPSVTVSHPGTGRELTIKSMPAIFAPGLGVDKQDAGKRGVLHTLWAKSRISHLEREIRDELQDNSESVALELAAQERAWIVEHFGLVDAQAPPSGAQPPPTPRSPRSPVGGRLGEKLRGLKLATSPSGLSSSTGPDSTQNHSTAASFQPAAAAASGTGSGPAVASLDAVMDNGKAAGTNAGRETEDELFALPMSPRSPEMKSSPFSFLK
jgi:hypothetical protein